ncbi:MAG: hypothetical protein ACREI2_09015 [Nitrospiraceae bacterium]
MTPRKLSHDEKKAAEAAFTGRPFNPAWSLSARAVYDGIVKALPAPVLSEQPSAADQFEPVETRAADDPTARDLQAPAASEQSQPEAESDQPLDVPQPQMISREEAIQRGYLIDVSPAAHEIGLPVPVGITRPLWEAGIAVADLVPDEQQAARVRDVLMALRLHLASSRALPPLFVFPALLSFPPKSALQLCSLCAVAQKDATAPFSLTLLLPGEVSSITLPHSDN